MLNMRLVRDYLPFGSYKRKMGNVECHNKHNLKIRLKSFNAVMLMSALDLQEYPAKSSLSNLAGKKP